MLKKFDQALSQKEKSMKQLFALIHEKGPISKNDLITWSGLTQTTCSRLIEELIGQNLIIDSGYGESKGGRKPHLYSIKAESYFLFGVDISRTYTKVLLLDLKLSVKTESRLKMDETSTPEVTIDFIVEAINKMRQNSHLNDDQVLGVGIGAIGPLDRESGIIKDPVHFPSSGWVDIPIQKILKDRLQMKVVLDYGVNTALLAEYQHSFSAGYKNVVYVIKGTGSRTGIIADGRLVRGSDKLGKFGQGHMVVDIHGRKCVCGGYGCVQAYSSIAAIRDDIIRGLKVGKESLLRDRVIDFEDINIEDIYWAVNLKDPLCSEVIRDAAYYAGIGLSNLINVTHPDLIILSGPTYTNMDLFYEVVTKTALERSQVFYPDHAIIFSRGELGENATAIGAGGILLDSYLKLDQ